MLRVVPGASAAPSQLGRVRRRRRRPRSRAVPPPSLRVLVSAARQCVTCSARPARRRRPLQDFFTPDELSRFGPCPRMLHLSRAHAVEVWCRPGVRACAACRACALPEQTAPAVVCHTTQARWQTKCGLCLTSRCLHRITPLSSSCLAMLSHCTMPVHRARSAPSHFLSPTLAARHPLF